MSEEEIQKLLDEASGLYNDGDYDGARVLWNRILEADPDNEQAREGIKMAELLTSDWEGAPPAPEVEGAAPPPAEEVAPPTAAGVAPPAAGGAASPPAEGAVPPPAGSVAPPPAGAVPAADLEVAARVAEGVRRVEELIAAGDLPAAREGIEALQQVMPGDPGVITCAAKVESAADPASYIQEQLAMARHHTVLGETGEALLSCRRVLALDPENAAAREMLRSQGGGEAPPSPPAEEPEPLELTLDSAEVAPDGAEPDPPADGPELDLSVAGAKAVVAKAEGTPEARIAALLAEGDGLRDQGRLDEAIDAWSRIFIIQDNNEDAERRIDAARRALEQQAGEMEEYLFRGEDLLGDGRLEEAREQFQAVLVIRRNHAEARSRLDEIERKLAGGAVGTESIPLQRPTPAAAAEPSAAVPSTDAVPLAAPVSPAEPRPVRSARPVTRPAPRRGGAGRMILVGALTVMLPVAGYFGWKQFFPVSTLRPTPLESAAGTEPPPEAAPQPEPPPTGTEPSPTAEPVTPDPGPPGPKVAPGQAHARSLDLMRSGISRFKAGDFRQAVAQFSQSLEVEPTNFEAQDWLAKSRDELVRVERFDTEVAAIRKLFDDRDYHSALYKLYRIEASDDVDKRRIEAWIGVCWYDWGVQLLKARSPSAAEEKLQEALSADPDDTEAAEHLEVAQRYRSLKPDASYEAYIARLTRRPLDN